MELKKLDFLDKVPTSTIQEWYTAERQPQSKAITLKSYIQDGNRKANTNKVSAHLGRTEKT